MKGDWEKVKVGGRKDMGGGEGICPKCPMLDPPMHDTLDIIM